MFFLVTFSGLGSFLWKMERMKMEIKPLWNSRQINVTRTVVNGARHRPQVLRIMTF